MTGKTLTASFLAVAIGAGAWWAIRPSEPEAEKTQYDKDFSPRQMPSGPRVSLQMPKVNEQSIIIAECPQSGIVLAIPDIPQDRFIPVPTEIIGKSVPSCPDADVSLTVTLPAGPLTEARSDTGKNGLVFYFPADKKTLSDTCPEIAVTELSDPIEWTNINDQITTSVTLNGPSHKLVQELGCAAVRMRPAP